MKTVTGVFASQSDAQHAMAEMRLAGARDDRITLLTPGSSQTELESVPNVAAEQPGMEKAFGAVVGAATDLSAGPLLLVAIIPGVGPVTAIGLLGGAVLAAAGAIVGSAASGSLENHMTEGLPEDEIFVYEDALRKGRSVVIVQVNDETQASRFREFLQTEGAETVDAAREQWWIGLRSAEQEHYSAHGRKFGDDEVFYRLGFESALHARTRCKEYDQTLGEMDAKIEELEKQYPGREVAEPFSRGYERSRDYYQHLCDKSRAA
jgi:outer membrane lipoprotein SlyB